MLNNLVNSDDVAVVVRKVVNGHVGEVASRLRAPGKDRIEAHWHDQWDVDLPPTQWFDLPSVRRRENRLISGDPGLPYIEYLSRQYLDGRSDLAGLSIGCGSGWRELEWGRRAALRSLAAYDISEAGIRQARADAEAAGLADVVDFRVGDINGLRFEPASFDVILLEDALHHFTPLDEIIPRLRSWLKPDGHLIVNEFVGATRFQWSRRQLELATAMLLLLPERYRLDWAGRVKRAIDRPSRLRMKVKDPSEAVESARIVPLLKSTFDIVEEKPTGGTLIYLVLDGIAHNFPVDDAQGQRLLDICFALEEELIAAEEIGSDHALLVCRPPA